MKKKQLVLGYGVTGKSVADYFTLNKQQFVVVDKKDFNTNKKKHVVVKEETIKNLAEFDEIIISPGINPKHPIIQEAKKRNITILSDIEMAVKILKKNPIIGITGTNGKTTLTLLVVHILNFSNKPAVALGNVGKSILSYLPEKKEKEILVIELSSFQLELLDFNFLQSAVIINIFEDHLDRYDDMTQYVKAKAKIQKCVKKGCILYLSKKIIEEYGNFFDLNYVASYQEIKKQDFAIAAKSYFIGEDLLYAAFCLCKQFGVSYNQFFNSLTNFSRQQHRIEFIDVVNEIYFYNDSKATNIASVEYALQHFDKRVVLIAGGEDKKLDFTRFNYFNNKISYIVAIGKTAKQIAFEVKQIPVFIEGTMQKAVVKAYNLAKKNEIVLLSPGCSSYDMFDNYEHRGNVFTQIVHRLKRGVEK